MLTEDQIKQRLKEKGWADFVYNGGSKRLLSSWKKLVELVENGYGERFVIEEYWNDLDTRKAIREVELDSLVKELDERFIAATTRRDIQIWGKEESKDYFWCYGYPKKAKGVFLEDLKKYFPI